MNILHIAAKPLFLAMALFEYIITYILYWTMNWILQYDLGMAKPHQHHFTLRRLCHSQWVRLDINLEQKGNWFASRYVPLSITAAQTKFNKVGKYFQKAVIQPKVKGKVRMKTKEVNCLQLTWIISNMLIVLNTTICYLDCTQVTISKVNMNQKLPSKL